MVCLQARLFTAHSVNLLRQAPVLQALQAPEVRCHRQLPAGSLTLAHHPNSSRHSSNHRPRATARTRLELGISIPRPQTIPTQGADLTRKSMFSVSRPLNRTESLILAVARQRQRARAAPLLSLRMTILLATRGAREPARLATTAQTRPSRATADP